MSKQLTPNLIDEFIEKTKQLQEYMLEYSPNNEDEDANSYYEHALFNLTETLKYFEHIQEECNLD